MYIYMSRGWKIIIAKEHITRGRGVKCLTRARMQITRATRRGRRKYVHIHPKRGRLFFPFCISHIIMHAQNKTENICIMFVFIRIIYLILMLYTHNQTRWHEAKYISDFIFRAMLIGCSIYTKKKKLSQWFLFTLNS